MGMEVTGLKDISPEIVPEEKENEMDTTNRYDNEFPDEDMFEQIVRNAEEAEREKERSKGKKHAIKNMTISLLQYTCCKYFPICSIERNFCNEVIFSPYQRKFPEI